MGLKAPSIVTFMLSVMLTMTALFTKFFGAEVKYLVGNELWVLLTAQLVLIMGCMMRGL